MRVVPVASLALLLACLPVSGGAATPLQPPPQPAAEPPAASANEPVTDLGLVVVSGELPGPGLWKISRGEHVLWLLGDLSPLPRDMQWQSRDVEAAIVQSQEIIQPPTVGLNANIGFFRGLTLLPSLLGARKNPEGKTLEQVVPPELYVRWRQLKARYIGRDNDVEQWRPVFAALELYEAAIAKAGLTRKSIVGPLVDDAAKRHDIRVTAPRVTVVIDDPKQALKEFRDETFGDLDCFRKTLDHLESDLGTMTARANAWATADLEAMQALPYTDQATACREALNDTGVVRKRGMADVEARASRAWMDAADAALARNASTFALLPFAELIKPNGYLDRLRARGYTVEAPL